MAGKADGRILIDTGIDPDGFVKDAKTLQSEANKLGAKVESIGTAFDRALNGDPKALEAFQEKAAQLQRTVERLGEDLAHLGEKKAPTDAYLGISEEAEKAGEELEKLLNKQEKLENRGVGKTSQTYKNLQADIAAASERYDQLIAKKAELEASGAAWTGGEQAEEYQRIAAAIDGANARLAAMRERIEDASRSSGGLLTAMRALPNPLNIAKSAFGGILRVLKSIASAFGRVVGSTVNLAKTVAKKILSAFKTVLSTVKKLFVGNRSLTGSVGDLTSALKRLAPAMLAARGAIGIIRKAVDAFLSANEQVANQLDACWRNLGEILGPIITKIVDLVSTAISYVTAFLKLLGFGVSSGTSSISAMGKAVAGVGSATKAAAISTENMGRTATAVYGATGGAAKLAADDINTVADAAEGAAKKIQNLSGLDQINTWKSPQSSAGGTGGGGGGGIEDLDVTLPTVELPDWAKLMAEQLRSGEWEAAAKTLSDKLNEMVDGVNWPGLGDRLGEKLGGALKFLATFIREFDFTELFTGLFTALKNALEKLDAEDIGALLAGKFVLIFSALQGAVQSGVIPAAIKKLGKAIEGFFATIREKFDDESDPEHGGWYVVGQNLGSVIGQIISAVVGLLEDTDWNDIIDDIEDFWGGLWSALKEGENAPDWDHLFDVIQTVCQQLLVRMARWLPQSDRSRKTWEELSERLEKGGEKVEWSEIFRALWDTLEGLVDEYIIPYLPTKDELETAWVELREKLCQAVAGMSWDELKESLGGKLNEIYNAAMDWIYEEMKKSHPRIAEFLFPGHADVDRAAENFNLYMERGMTRSAKEQLASMEEAGGAMAAKAAEIAKDMGESFTEESLSTVEVEAQKVADIYRASGQSAANAYMNGLVNDGVLKPEELSSFASMVSEELMGNSEAYAAAGEAGGQAYGGGFQEGASEGLEGIDGTVEEKLGGANVGVDKAMRRSRELVRLGFAGARSDAAAEAAGMSAEVQSSYDSMATTVGDKSSGMDSANSTHWGAMKAMLVSMADIMMQKVVGVYGVIGDKINTILARASTTSNTSWTAIKNDAVNASVAMKTSVVSNWGAAASAIQGRCAAIREVVQSVFGALRSSAYGWGADLGALFANGLQSMAGVIAMAASNAAAAARAYLHFSLPDKGPLADADEYGPDLVKTLAEGMTKNKGLAGRAAAQVAGEVSKEIQSGEYDLPQIRLEQVDTTMGTIGDKLTGGFSALMDKLQAIVDSVSFRVPAVATAGVIPYSVTGAGDGNFPGAAAGAPRDGDQSGDKEQTLTLNLNVRGDVDGETLFRVVMSKAAAVKKRTGKNPFVQL